MRVQASRQTNLGAWGYHHQRLQRRKSARVFVTVMLAMFCTGCLHPPKPQATITPTTTLVEDSPPATQVALGNSPDQEQSQLDAPDRRQEPVVRPVSFEPNVPAYSAARPTESGLTLEALESLAAEHNPSIRQAEAIAGQAVGIRNQVRLRPNPTIGYFGEEIGNDDTAGLHGAFVSQTFVRGNKLQWNRAVIHQEVRRARWQAEVQRQRVRNDVHILFYEALGAQQRLALAQAFRGQAAEGVEISKARVAAQEAARPDVLQSEVLLGEVDLTIQQAALRFDAAWQGLAAVVGLPELDAQDLVGDFYRPAEDLELESTYEKLLASSPELAAACAEVERAKVNWQRQRVQAVPNVTAQLGTGHDHTTGNEFANVQLTMPIPVHNQNQGNVQAAYAAYCAATQNVARLKMRLRRDLATSYRAYAAARLTVDQYESLILPKARETQELIQTGRRAGEFDFLRVLTAGKSYFEANLAYVDALTELSKAATVLDGQLLQDSLAAIQIENVSSGLRGSALSGQ